ncbi:hypothetical protein ASPZODRAFT_126754 [Penicilliopsis zonata CBS 506.65]|uniref:Sensitive to high expression protein 9, mitochondrial n=1 Tax=Penicilliopsis zonata CBS 506.65 TaxID=1073090 RepID=A0A1L9SUJ1_9EURO|nr:hypothetical protein ASPZODRAFT_126754 [Penicilliopsis zonata CBS 506.65]OJJ50806.1 hypothetical protein ASPZODRAFT_126754 [Penicilliopsis zonata CBS 506.65]
MQSVPLLLRQSLRSGLTLSTRPARPLRPPQFPPAKAARIRSREPLRSFSVCLRCQFRTNPSLFLDNESNKSKEPQAHPSESVNTSSWSSLSDNGSSSPIVDSGEVRHTIAEETKEKELRQGEKNQTREESPDDPATQRGSLPSYLDERRSQLSKRFSSVMDNLQSNVFVAGQRLNDFTGYSAIEVLKRDIQEQEERVRACRMRVQETKLAYAGAINERSTSQREINELLQRKHAWSAPDLERFTHLYRNDHANEVAEHEAQEALSAAEREAEEAATQLSKSILSRYHEEQVWSDKIRRMSTWGTWGLMGVNVLLFLVFQIAVEPWRRRRLVRGFEEKVIEALEKEKALSQAQITSAIQSAIPESFTAPTPPPAVLEPEPEPVIIEETIPEVIDSEIVTDPPEEADPKPEQATVTSATAVPDTVQPEISHYPQAIPASATKIIDHILQTSQSQLSQLSRLLFNSWPHDLHDLDLFSERSISLSRREFTAVAIQSAAAGAALTGLIIALIR